MAPTAQLPGSPPRKRSRKAATDDNVTRPLSAHSHVHWGIKRPRFEVKLDSGNDPRIPKRERYSPSVDESPSKISASTKSDAKADSDPTLCAVDDDVVAAGTRSSRHPPVSQKTIPVDSEAETEEPHGPLRHGDDKEPRADDGASILPQGTSGTPAASVTVDAKEGDLDATVISGNSRVDVKSASDPVGGPHKDTPTTHLTSLSSTESSAVRPDGDNAVANAAKDASVNPSAHLDLLGSPSDDTQGVSTPTASRPDQGPAVIPDSSGHLTDKSRSIEHTTNAEVSAQQDDVPHNTDLPFGILSEFPSDLLYEILGHASPLTLLTLSRVNHAFREVLMSRKRRNIWKRSIKAANASYVRFPLCPKGITEPQWVRLVFENDCTFCGASDVHPEAVDWYWLKRICKDCWPQLTMTDEECVTMFPAGVWQPGKLSLPCVVPLAHDLKGREPGQYYYLKQYVERISRRINTVAAVSRKELEDMFRWENLALQTNGCTLYQSVMRMRSSTTADRMADIERRLRAENYGPILDNMDFLSRAYFEGHPDVCRSEPMDHESWAEIKPSILDLLRCIEKEQVARREKAKDDDNSDEDWNEEWVGDDGSADEALGTDAVDSDGY